MATSTMKSFGSLAEGYAQDLTALAYQGSDLILNQLPGGLYGSSLAEKIQAPQILAGVIPLTPTAERPMLAFPQLFAALPGYNRLSHWLAYQVVWQGLRQVINKWRKRDLALGNAPIWGYFRDTWNRTPVLNGFSPLVVPRPADWGKQIRMTGYWYPEEEEWIPEGRL
jgi:hypothetical protein